ncbi:RidA family protein [Chloroflexi bacterium TSY]|nr:RidA family protein [Chloroflexi bacterium TSY]
MNGTDNNKGNYHFVSGIAPYSAGVVAMTGFEIIHVTLKDPVPYQQGFDLIDQHLTTEERPRHALCAIELRLPQALPFNGFTSFNTDYRALLTEWDLLLEDENPVARTNVAPEIRPPSEPSLYGFSYTTACEPDSPRTFVVAGAGDLRDQADLQSSAVVRPGETSTDALVEKATCVMGVMEERLFGLGCNWDDVTTVNVYTVQPLHNVLVETILQPLPAAAIHGVQWYYSHPPIDELVFEMDLRGVRKEHWV